MIACKTKILYRYEYFGPGTYEEFTGNLKKLDFKSSISNRFLTEEDVHMFKYVDRHETVRK